MGKPCIHHRKIERLRHTLLPLLKRLSHDMAQFIHANCSWMYYSHCVKSLNLLFLLNLIIYCYLKLIQRSSQIIYDQCCEWWKSQIRQHYQMGSIKWIWYLPPMRAAKVQASLRICAVSAEPLLLAHTSSESRGAFRQKARSLAPLNGWACTVKICHDEMLEGKIRFWRATNANKMQQTYRKNT